MSWEDQGRDELGRFGDGKGPEKPKDTSGGGGTFGLGGLSQRIQAVAYGTIGALPQVLRARASAQYDAGNLARLTEAMTAWVGGIQLSNAAFADRFFGRAANDPIAEKLHDAVLDVGLATSHAELREAAEKAAGAMKAIGLDGWPRFLADAQDRARDPETVAAVEKSRRPPDPAKDAIRPVYPVETAIGIGAAGIAGGGVALLRAAGGALLRQVLPKSGSRTGSAGGGSAEGAVNAERPTNATGSGGIKGESGATDSPSEMERPPISRQKQNGHIRDTPQSRNRLKQGTPTSVFDGDSAQAEALTQEAWEKGKPVPNKPDIRQYDFGRRISEGPNGDSQSIVRVHQDSAGRIHGHPSGWETP